MMMKIEKTDRLCSILFQWVLAIIFWHLLLNYNIMCILINIFCNLQQQVSQRNAPHLRAHSEAPNAPKWQPLLTPGTRTTHTGTLSICS